MDLGDLPLLPASALAAAWLNKAMSRSRLSDFVFIRPSWQTKAAQIGRIGYSLALI
jgi:hypothetical protein